MDVMRIWGVSVIVGPPKENVLVSQRKVKDNSAIWQFIRIRRVTRESIRCLKPL